MDQKLFHAKKNPNFGTLEEIFEKKVEKSDELRSIEEDINDQKINPKRVQKIHIKKPNIKTEQHLPQDLN